MKLRKTEKTTHKITSKGNHKLACELCGIVGNNKRIKNKFYCAKHYYSIVKGNKIIKENYDNKKKKI